MNNYLIFIIILVIIFIYVTPDDITTLCITASNDKRNYHSKIKKFEKKLAHWYPLGSDYFKITHGKNYYKFFERLGQLTMIACMHKNNIIGTFFGVLRKIHNKKVWYIADFKIDPLFRGKQLSYAMLSKGVPKLLTTTRFYGISMNTTNKKNKVLTIANKVPFVNIKSNQLLIYSVNYDQLLNILPILTYFRGRVSYLSLNGVKEMKLKSTQKRMNVFHIQWTTNTKNTISNVTNIPIPNYTYMFCCLHNDLMVSYLRSKNVTTDITATIIYNNMDHFDWKFILTSDI
jgi:hypothetical protein